MAKYTIDSATMAGIADPLRFLAGTENTMTPMEMAAVGNDAVSDMTNQAALIEQIKTVLAGKAAGGSGGDPTLPAGYVRCGYIRFTGEQIVDTDIIGNQDTKIKVIFTRDTDGTMYLFGVASDGNTASITAYISSGGSWRFGNRSVARSISIGADIVHTAIQDKTGVNSATGKNTYSTPNAFETIGSIPIGTGRGSNGVLSSAQYVGKVLVFEIWQGDEEVQHLIPVVSVDGETFRFYDTVSGNFFDSITDVPLGGGNL